jgi:hypothetical protein
LTWVLRNNKFYISSFPDPGGQMKVLPMVVRAPMPTASQGSCAYSGLTLLLSGELLGLADEGSAGAGISRLATNQ